MTNASPIQIRRTGFRVADQARGLEPGITWYDVLGAVPDAPTRTIKRKYQDKAALLRPELISGARPNVLATVTRAQHLLDTAWGVLGDPDRRTRYDEAVGLRRSGGGLGQPGTGIESAGMAEADPGTAGELADGLLGGLLELLPEELAPRRRRNRPGAVPDVRGLFYPVCLEVATRQGLHARVVRLTERPMPVDGLVVDQDPRPPSRVRRGDQLTVWLWHPPAGLFLNGPAHGSQVIAETQGRGPLALGQVAVEPHLTAQGDTCVELSGLASLGVADCLRKREDFLGAAGRHEQHPIVIAQDQVRTIHGPISHRGGRQRIRDPGIETLRAGRDRSQAEDRQPDRLDVGGVAMQPPDHDSVQPCSLCLQNHQVADATLIEAPVVVGHQHLARCGPVERLEENIDAAGMAGGTHPPSEPATEHDRVQARRRAAHREPSADACIGQVGSG